MIPVAYFVVAVVIVLFWTLFTAHIAANPAADELIQFTQRVLEPILFLRLWVNCVYVHIATLMLLFAMCNVGDVYVCEQGLFVGLAKVIPWSKFRSWEWKTSDPPKAVLRGKWFKREIKTTPAERQKLAELLDRLVPAAADKPELVSPAA